MKDWGIIAIVLGVLGALLGVYLRESVRRAHQQKIIATKLEAYLINWSRHLLEGPFQTLFVLGYSWSEDETKQYQLKGSKGLEEVKQQYLNKLKEIKSAIEKGDKDIRVGVEEMHREIRALTDEQFSLSLEQLSQSEESLLRNYSFIADEEAAILSWSCANHVIPMKSAMQAMMSYTKQLLVALRSLSVLNLLVVSVPLYKLIESGIYMAKHYMPLLRHAQEIRGRNLLGLTFKNLVQ